MVIDVLLEIQRKVPAQSFPVGRGGRAFCAWSVPGGAGTAPPLVGAEARPDGPCPGCRGGAASSLRGPAGPAESIENIVGIVRGRAWANRLASDHRNVTVQRGNDNRLSRVWDVNRGYVQRHRPIAGCGGTSHRLGALPCFGHAPGAPHVRPSAAAWGMSVRHRDFQVIEKPRRGR
jgi:hypothetical protein